MIFISTYMYDVCQLYTGVVWSEIVTWEHGEDQGFQWWMFYLYSETLTFSIISQHWDCAGSWDPSSKKTRTHWSCMYNTMVADALAIQTTWTSAANGLIWLSQNILVSAPGSWFNIKMPSYKYRKSHCVDKTILRPSYLHNRISYTGKMASLYWIRAQRVKCAVWELSFGP